MPPLWATQHKSNFCWSFVLASLPYIFSALFSYFSSYPINDLDNNYPVEYEYTQYMIINKVIVDQEPINLLQTNVTVTVAQGLILH